MEHALDAQGQHIVVLAVDEYEQLANRASVVDQVVAAMQRMKMLLRGDLTEQERIDCTHELRHLMALAAAPLREKP